jgi:hypothetical protein
MLLQDHKRQATKITHVTVSSVRMSLWMTWACLRAAMTGNVVD